MILYHGSNCDIERFDLSMCKPFKDFGQSFYFKTGKVIAFLQKRPTV